MSALHDIIAGSLDVDSGIIGRRVLFDRVSLVGLDFNVALLGDFSDGTTRAARTPLPGHCIRAMVSNQTAVLDGARLKRVFRRKHVQQTRRAAS